MRWMMEVIRAENCNFLVICSALSLGFRLEDRVADSRRDGDD